MSLKNESDTLPISVIVTLQESRQAFFCGPVILAIVENRPAEIIVELGQGGASEKRNRGWRKATQPFLFFCDDDVVLYQDALRTLHEAIDGKDSCGVAYGHYKTVHAGGVCKTPDGKIIIAQPFTRKHLKDGNTISVMSLVRAEAFPGWDETLMSYIDWDCWLAMEEHGWGGVLVDDVLFDAHYLDSGISAQNYGTESLAYIRKKHGGLDG